MQVEQDFLQRQIRQIVQALARITGVAGARLDDRKRREARDAIDRGYEDLLGVERAAIEHVDDASAVMMLGRGDKLDLYIWLLARDAELSEPARASALRERAARLARSSADRAP
ncbi:MAG TPA: hypothetical protein VFP84_04260 [Kofleriaceae bacterium]|nr:hypothetical protein [Kofleriaceae bacterium]